jgi:putative SOS response-associated peptidase YedK
VEDGEGETTFTIITTGANEVIEPIHDRMPVILDSDAADEWLFAPPDETERLLSVLEQAPADWLAI